MIFLPGKLERLGWNTVWLLGKWNLFKTAHFGAPAPNIVYSRRSMASPEAIRTCDKVFVVGTNPKLEEIFDA